MIEVLSKPADQINRDDIHALIVSEVPEGEQIEFKESLPAKKQTPDPWMTDKDQIGDFAKDKILTEVVAFANAHGGALLLGIKESNTKPPVAADILPIPRCTDLAERLKLVFRDRVEPQLPMLEVFAVQTEGESGVIIIRVGRSRLAPHRVTKTLVCPVRRSDRCEEMTMREIQDMTLNVSRGLERLEKRLFKRSKRFQEEFKRLKTPEDAFGIRLTATPVGEEIRIDRVFRQGRISNEFSIAWLTVSRQRGADQNTLYSPFNPPPSAWQPILRGTRAEFFPGPSNLSANVYRELHCDGLVELGLVRCSAELRSNPIFSPDWLVVMFANLAVWADRIRNQASAPTTEYALEAEIRVLGNAVFPYSPPFTSYLTLPNVVFPRYCLNDTDEIPRLLALFEHDCWNCFHEDISDGQGTLEIRNP